jgi:aryl-alcohol dehydrogenase
VVVGFDMCDRCGNCAAGLPQYCDDHIARNFLAARADGSTGLHDGDGRVVHDHFFGQSSLATHGLVRPTALVKVADDLPLKTLGPLACGIATGAGAVFNRLQVVPGASVAVFGLGAVGLSAVMAAKVNEAAEIIAIDVNAGRLDLARELGATQVIHATGERSDEAVLKLTRGRGVDYSVESSGSVAVMEDAIRALAPRGAACILGVAALDAELRANVFELLKGRSITGTVVGHEAPKTLIPWLVELYRSGRLPYDRLVRTYPLAEINQAVADVESGATVKAVLVGS